MTRKEAIEILKKHNAWRRGENDDPVGDVKLLGEAIDFAVEEMVYLDVFCEKLNFTQDEADGLMKMIK